MRWDRYRYQVSALTRSSEGDHRPPPYHCASRSFRRSGQSGDLADPNGARYRLRYTPNPLEVSHGRIVFGGARGPREVGPAEGIALALGKHVDLNVAILEQVVLRSGRVRRGDELVRVGV